METNITDEVLQYIRKDAKKHARRFYLEYDEAVSVAYLELVEIDKQFDSEKEIPFLSFARQRIRWRHLTNFRDKHFARNGDILTRKYEVELEEHHIPKTSSLIKQLEARDFLRKIEKIIDKGKYKKKNLLKEYLVDRSTGKMALRASMSQQSFCQKTKRLKVQLQALHQEYLAV